MVVFHGHGDKDIGQTLRYEVKSNVQTRDPLWKRFMDDVISESHSNCIMTVIRLEVIAILTCRSCKF